MSAWLSGYLIQVTDVNGDWLIKENAEMDHAIKMHLNRSAKRLEYNWGENTDLEEQIPGALIKLKWTESNWSAIVRVHSESPIQCSRCFL